MKKFLIITGAVIVVILVVVGVMFVQMMNQMTNEDPGYWEKTIAKIEDRYLTEPDADIVFVGSSSIRKWESLDDDFAGYEVLNHGFGGSKVADTTWYFDRLVTPFSPEAVVVFTGTNDINGKEGNSKTGEEVAELVKDLHAVSQTELPDVPFLFISISPTEARWKVWEEALTANNLIKEYAGRAEGFFFIDTTEALMRDGIPNAELFVGDGLHLNEAGYQAWADIIRPVVEEAINQ